MENGARDRSRANTLRIPMWLGAWYSEKSIQILQGLGNRDVWYTITEEGTTVSISGVGEQLSRAVCVYIWVQVIMYDNNKD